MKNRKKILALVIALALMLCLLPATALAEPADEETPAETTAEPAESPDAADPAGSPAESVEESTAEPVCNEAGETLYAEPGSVTYNNGGTVFSNGGTVYNNEGLVYNNGGLVYNNGGTVYSNGGTVYNNSGKIYNNGAAVYTNGGSVEDSVVYGYYRVSFADDYSALADFEGLDTEPGSGALLIKQGGTCLITPREGCSIILAETSSGKLLGQEDGSYLLSDFDESLTLTLKFKAQAPVFSQESGTYKEALSVELSAAEGAEIYYTTDGSEISEASEKYEGPVAVEEGMIIKAAALVQGAEFSDTVQAEYAVPKLTAPKFDTLSEGYSRPAAQGIAVDNSGVAAAKIESVALEGEDAKCFTLNRTNGGLVAAGAVDDSTWAVRPIAGLEKGSYTALAVFTFDSGDTLQVKLSFRVK